jgi:hypothetical protein
MTGHSIGYDAMPISSDTGTHVRYGHCRHDDGKPDVRAARRYLVDDQRRAYADTGGCVITPAGSSPMSRVADGAGDPALQAAMR